MAICFICNYRGKEPELGTKQASDKNGMKEIFGLYVKKEFAAEKPDDFLQEWRWVDEKITQTLICNSCFRWFFTASEADVNSLRESLKTPVVPLVIEENNLKRVRSESDDDSGEKPIQKKSKSSDDERPFEFVSWPDLSTWCTRTDHEDGETIEKRKNLKPCELYTTDFDNYLWKIFRFYPVHYWGCSNVQFDKTVLATFDKWVNEGLWEEFERDEETIEYHFIDFDLYDAEMNRFCLRMELNFGNMGLNTGVWGTVRLRNSGKLVVKIEDEDCDTTSRFTFIQNSIQFVQFPSESFPEDKEIKKYVTGVRCIYSSEHQLERIISAVINSPSDLFSSFQIPEDVKIGYQLYRLKQVWKNDIYPEEILRLIASYSYPPLFPILH